jgi:hypothetical protein
METIHVSDHAEVWMRARSTARVDVGVAGRLREDEKPYGS